MKQIKVELQETMGSDRSVADAAWTSSIDYQKKKARTDEDVKRIIKMLADNKHSVPFESVVFRFWIKLPIQTDRQLMTHRLQSASGMSGRYRTMPNEYLDVPEDVEATMGKFVAKYDNPAAVEQDLFQSYYDLCGFANEYYQMAIQSAKKAEKAGQITNHEYKRFREFYRGILPQNNMTERVTTMNLRSFANFIKLRLSPHAQPEIRYVAEQMLQAVKSANVCPQAIEYLEQNGWEL